MSKNSIICQNVCDLSCATCSGPSAQNCISCIDGKFLDTDNSCKPCSSLCKTCDGPLANNCKTCYFT